MSEQIICAILKQAVSSIDLPYFLYRITLESLIIGRVGIIGGLDIAIIINNSGGWNNSGGGGGVDGVEK